MTSICTFNGLRNELTYDLAKNDRVGVVPMLPFPGRSAYSTTSDCGGRPATASGVDWSVMARYKVEDVAIGIDGKGYN